MKRMPPVRGFSRGIPIVGQNEQRRRPSPGRYHYAAPALISRDGGPMAAESFAFAFGTPLMLREQHEAIRERIVTILKEREPDAPEPSVVVLQPYLLEFESQAELDAKARLKEADAAATAAEQGDDIAEARRLRKIADDIAEEMGMRREHPLVVN